MPTLPPHSAWFAGENLSRCPFKAAGSGTTASANLAAWNRPIRPQRLAESGAGTGE